MKLSARNLLKGKIVEVKKGTTTAHVRIDIGGTVITAAITNDSVDELKLEKGGTVLRINGTVTIENPSEEYEQIYEHFARLLKKGKSDVSDACVSASLRARCCQSSSG